LISLEFARRLKAAGLVWQAGPNDFFAIPDRGMDDRLFVLADMQAQLDLFRGWPVVTFHGTAEWALDYILTSEVIWMPREEQLRDALLSNLPASGNARISLTFENDLFTCSLSWRGENMQFNAASAGDAYAKALLFVLENSQTT
jgi:hypothetical protein